MDAVLNLFVILLAALANGGGLSYLLDRLPGWVAWQHPAKPFVVLVLTGIAGILLVLAQMYTPQVWSLLPLAAQAVISWMATWLASQLVHQHDRKQRAAAQDL